MRLALILLVSAAVLGGLNALRGAGLQWLRYVIAAVAGGLALLQGGGYALAGAQAAGVLVFLLQPWGRWYTLGHGDRAWSGGPSDYEQSIERIGGSSDYLCWAISATLFSLPLALLVSPVWLLAGPVAPLLYALSWATGSPAAIRGGEACTGVLLASLAVLAHTLWRSPILHLLGFN